MNKIDLHGRVAVITGGARGIGHTIAEGMIISRATVMLRDIDSAPSQEGSFATGAIFDISGGRVVY